MGKRDRIRKVFTKTINKLDKIVEGNDITVTRNLGIIGEVIEENDTLLGESERAKELKRLSIN